MDGFLGALAKFRKATIRFVMYVRPSVRMEQLDFNWTDFYEIRYLSIYLKTLVIIQVSLRSNE